jgi:uncharacterized membrane protein
MKKTGISSVVAVSIVFTLTVIIFRILYTAETYFIFLVWNLFLAWLPYFISLQWEKERSPVFQWASMLLWLLVFPNAPYIITDLYHLNDRPGIPQWFDLLLLFSAAWNGLLLGLLSLYNAEKFLLKKLTAIQAGIVLAGCVFLSGFGVYAGRYLRWNSWEIFTQPKSILHDTVPRILHPEDHLSTWGMTLMMGSFLLIIYHTMKIIGAAKTQGGTKTR